MNFDLIDVSIIFFGGILGYIIFIASKGDINTFLACTLGLYITVPIVIIFLSIFMDRNDVETNYYTALTYICGSIIFIVSKGDINIFLVCILGLYITVPIVIIFLSIFVKRFSLHFCRMANI